MAKLDSNNKSFLVAISHSNVMPWTDIKKTQESTWIDQDVELCDVIFYLSKPNNLLIEKYDKIIEAYRFSKRIGFFISKINQIQSLFISHEIPEYNFIKQINELHVDSWSTYQLFGRRNLALYDWFIHHTRHDFIFQTNISSYLNLELLKKKLENFDPTKKIYAGKIINSDHIPFPIVSGAGKLLSRALVELILENRKFLKFDNLEDVALAKLISSLGVGAYDLPRFDLPNLDTLNSTSIETLNSHFHFRCKSDSIPRNDSEIMTSLHGRLHDKRYKSDKERNVDGGSNIWPPSVSY